jgi:hypothetical protein
MECRIFVLNGLRVNSFHSYVVRDAAGSAAKKVARQARYL